MHLKKVTVPVFSRPVELELAELLECKKRFTSMGDMRRLFYAHHTKTSGKEISLL